MTDEIKYCQDCLKEDQTEWNEIADQIAHFEKEIDNPDASQISKDTSKDVLEELKRRRKELDARMTRYSDWLKELRKKEIHEPPPQKAE